jgi:hypothetical protein
MFERFDTPVRCSAGHLFTTIWVPLGSLKAVRLGGTRYQYCPVGHHWGDRDSAGPGRHGPGRGGAREGGLRARRPDPLARSRLMRC